MVLGGVLCPGGLLRMVFRNMNIRDIGIPGYAVVLPAVVLLLGRVFVAATPSAALPPAR